MQPVLFIAASDDLYGASRALLSHLLRMRAHAIEPILAVPRAGALSAAAEKAEITTWIEPALGSTRSLKSRLLTPLRLKKLRAPALSAGVELVVGSTLSAAPPATRLANLLGVPSIVHLRSTYAWRDKTDRFRRYGVERATVIAAVSRAVLRELGADEDGRRRVVLPDGIEPAMTLSREEARRSLGLDPRARVAAIVGVISPRKGTAFAARVALRTPDLTLAIFGDGDEPLPESPQLRRYGFREDVRRLLSAADVLLHPARGEAFGLAPLEAMDAGVPVIASNVDGLPDTLGDAAILLDPRDEGAWCEAVERVLREPGAWIERGRIRAAQMSAENSARGAAALYKRVIAGPAA